MPQDQSQLRDLLALLAELQQGSLPGVLVQQVGDVGQGAAIVLGDGVVDAAGAGILGTSAVGGRVEGVDVTVGVGAGEAIVVLLLGGRGGGCGGLLGVVLLVAGLLVHPGRVGLWVVLVVSVDVRIGHHLGRSFVGDAALMMRWETKKSNFRVGLERSEAEEGFEGCWETKIEKAKG